MKKFKLFIVFFLIAFAFTLYAQSTFAQDNVDGDLPAPSEDAEDANPVTAQPQAPAIPPTASTDTPCSGDDCVDPFSGVALRTGADADPRKFAEIAISAFLSFIGVISLLFFVYGGLQWMIARGDSGKVQSAQKTIIWAIIGIVVVFGAYSLNSFLFDVITKPGVTK